MKEISLLFYYFSIISYDSYRASCSQTMNDLFTMLLLFTSSIQLNLVVLLFLGMPIGDWPSFRLFSCRSIPYKLFSIRRESFEYLFTIKHE